MVLASCTKKSQEDTYADGYKPVYISKELAFVISSNGPKAFTSPGKMFLYQNFIYITDNGTGVHIIDNSDPVNPVKLAFISIPGVRDVVVKNNILLADNFTDLISLDVSDVANIQFKKRLQDIYPMENQLYPDFATGSFECADTSYGYVLTWERATLKNPKCYR